ncbi:MAG: serine protease, partial [Bdellovibrionota bacterium]
NLCKEEPFRDQLSLGFCSGFLVAPDTMVTAGHCIRTESACSSTSFVFGFNVQNAGAYPTETPADQVYKCAKLVNSVVESAGKDYAVVKLDRPVVGHNPLKLRQSGAIQVSDAVVVMGYPSGIPLKISGGAKVRSVQTGFFVANLDTYGGNSGSAVFNETTGEVEGILVRGEADFVTQGSCRVSNRCADSDCRGEDVTRITEVLKDL